MSEPLKPCPRCGCEMLVFRGEYNTWDAMCTGNDCLDEQVFMSEEQAVAAANRRTPGPATAKMLDVTRAKPSIWRTVEEMAFIAEHEPAKGEVG